MPTPDQIRATMTEYGRAFQAGDRAAWLATFAPDAVQHDPVGSAPNVGHEQIGRFWDSVRPMMESAEFDVQRVIVCGDEAVMCFSIRSRFAGGGAALIEPVDVITFDDDGRITSLKAYWDPADVRMLDG